jgi:hypothetical protein
MRCPKGAKLREGHRGTNFAAEGHLGVVEGVRAGDGVLLLDGFVLLAALGVKGPLLLDEAARRNHGRGHLEKARHRHALLVQHWKLVLLPPDGRHFDVFVQHVIVNDNPP